ncbi:MAG: metal ABC transporter permease [Candidatus Njordarchaeales archaeon]
MPSVLDLLSNPFVLRALIAVLLASMLSATTGNLTIFKGLSFFVATIAHAAMAGAALAIFLASYGIYPLNPIIGGCLFGITLSVLLGIASKGTVSSEKLDAITGISFALSMSLAILFISLIKEYAVQAWGLIMGDLLLLTMNDILLMIITSTIVVFLIILLLREFLFISFDPEGAEAFGLKTSLYNVVMLTLVALSVVVMMKAVGAILVYVIMIIPAATANRIARTPFSTVYISFLVSLFSGVVGLILALYIDIAPSALIGIIATLIYLLSLIKGGK